jgi:hypothetical protein
MRKRAYVPLLGAGRPRAIAPAFIDGTNLAKSMPLAAYKVREAAPSACPRQLCRQFRVTACDPAS